MFFSQSTRAPLGAAAMDDGARIPLVALQTAVRADVDAREHNDIARKREAARLYVAAIAALEAGLARE